LVNASPARIDVEEVTERPNPSAGLADDVVRNTHSAPFKTGKG